MVGFRLWWTRVLTSNRKDHAHCPGEFCQLCATFLVEDPDMETMKKELKDAFRVYDKEGQGFITTETLRGLIGATNIPCLQFFRGRQSEKSSVTIK